MLANGIEYDLVITSANDFDNVSIECTSDNVLIAEAELFYASHSANICFHQFPLTIDFVKAFTAEVERELTQGAGSLAHNN